MQKQTLRRIPIRSSLIRPLLLAGGERLLVMINCTLIVALIFGVGINQFTLISAAFLATVGHWCLVQAAKADPEMTRVYLRHIHYQAFYPAQSSVHANSMVIHSSLLKGVL